jgi:hypothetical protein
MQAWRAECETARQVVVKLLRGWYVAMLGWSCKLAQACNLGTNACRIATVSG